MKFLVLLAVAIPMISCGSKFYQKESKEQINYSALYAPPTVTLIPNKEYQFKEGILTPKKELKYHSHYSYLRAIVIGSK